MVLILIKPYWFVWTSCRKTFWNLSARSLVKSFRQEFKSEFGLKSLTPSGECFFGTRITKDELTLWRPILSSWKSLQNCWKSLAMVDQQLFENNALNLSGPGALSEGILTITSSISFWEKGAERVRRLSILGILSFSSSNHLTAILATWSVQLLAFSTRVPSIQLCLFVYVKWTMHIWKLTMKKCTIQTVSMICSCKR